MAKKPAPRTSTGAVADYRARLAKSGGDTLYVAIDKETIDALDTIMMRKMCSKREATETALRRYAKEVARPR